MDEGNLLNDDLEHYIAGLMAGLLSDYSKHQDSNIKILPPIILENGIYDSSVLVELGNSVYKITVEKKGSIDER